MSSHPNSSRNYQKNMYSSLPSASKIYVSSSKSKQKSIPSAKRKRKKSEPESSISESISDETLVSLTSPIKSSSRAENMRQNIEKKVVKTLQKEEWVKKFIPLDDSDSDSYTHDDKVKVVNTYFDVCIESDEFNEDRGKSDHESEEVSDEMSSNDIAINAQVPDHEIALTNNFTMDVTTLDEKQISNNPVSNNDRNDNKTEELSKFVKNSFPEAQQSDFEKDDGKNIVHDSISVCLVNETVEDIEKNLISEEIKCLTLKDDGDGSESFCNSQCEVSTRDVIETKAEVDESFKVNTKVSESLIVENVSQEPDYKIDEHSNCNSDLKNGIKDESTVRENVQRHSIEGDEVEKPNEEPNEQHCPKISEFKNENNINEKMPLQSDFDINKSMLSKDNLKAKKTMTLKDCLNTEEKIDYNDCHNIHETMILRDCINIDAAINDTLEQDSCTESELVVSDHSSEVNVKIKGDPNINNFEYQAELFPIKRSISLPNNLYTVRDLVHFTANVGSNITLSSDKATITSDLPFEDSDKNIKCLNKDQKYRDSDCNTVSSGDVPVVDILPTLTMLKAKMRSYVFGCKGLDGALLGSEELSRFFPNNRITVFVGTWNMNGHDSPKNIDDFLLPHDSETLPDIYAVGVQESMQSKYEWELLLQTTLGPSHVLFPSTSLGVLHLAILIRRDLIWFCSEPEDANIATRVGSMVKTKGAVAICFMLFGTSFLFINAHLTAHEQNLVDRISDYEKICSGLDLPKNIPSSRIGYQDKNVTSRFDCAFWCGDLNFRIVWNRSAVLHFMKDRNHSDNNSCSLLLKHDQLLKAIKEGAAFHGFQEGFINFDPSFKFDVGTNAFDSTKERVPSYTDRILYRCKDSAYISCLHYNSVPKMVSSDHKPVYGIFSVALKPGRDNVPLAAGIFKRDVYLEALKRRAHFLEVNRNQKQSTVCSIM